MVITDLVSFLNEKEKYLLDFFEQLEDRIELQGVKVDDIVRKTRLLADLDNTVASSNLISLYDKLRVDPKSLAIFLSDPFFIKSDGIGQDKGAMIQYDVPRVTLFNILYC